MKINGIIAVSGIFERGSSKMNAQAHARFNGASGSHAVAQCTGLYSDSSYNSYKAVWNQYASHLKEELGIKQVERSTSEHIRNYLESRIDEGIALSTWQKEAAALNKLAVALDRVSFRLGWNKEYDFSRDIDSLRSSAAMELHKSEESRAYHSPENLISALKNEAHITAAKLQLEGGGRIREISNLSVDQFKGYKNDSVTNQQVGVIHIDNGKGGYQRDMCITPDTYEKALCQAQQDGKFSIDHTQYRNELKSAALATSERYSGSHGLRWNFAQNSMQTLQQNGLGYKQSLLETSERMGHHRAEITERYLK